jgi:hypothetical protein
MLSENLRGLINAIPQSGVSLSDNEIETKISSLVSNIGVLQNVAALGFENFI